jgi:hypothetical protein
MSGPQVELEGRALKIYPVRGKVPCCEGGYKAAVSDPQQIHDLFLQYRNAQIAVATGQINDLDILDIDVRHHGDRWLEENRDRLPVTRTHSTPGGGWHLLFRHAPGLRGSQGRIAEGVDVIGDGGGVVWHPAQGWPVQEAVVAEWPGWLLEMAKGKGASKTFETGRSGLSGVQRTRNVRMRTGKILGVVQRARAGDGRNAKLYWAARRFGELVAEGLVGREIAEDMLLGVARYNGHVAKHGRVQTDATIRSGLDHKVLDAPLPSSGASSTQEETP